MVDILMFCLLQFADLICRAACESLRVIIAKEEKMTRAALAGRGFEGFERVTFWLFGKNLFFVGE